MSSVFHVLFFSLLICLLDFWDFLPVALRNQIVPPRPPGLITESLFAKLNWVASSHRGRKSLPLHVGSLISVYLYGAGVAMRWTQSTLFRRSICSVCLMAGTFWISKRSSWSNPSTTYAGVHYLEHHDVSHEFPILFAEHKKKFHFQGGGRP